MSLRGLKMKKLGKFLFKDGEGTLLLAEIAKRFDLRSKAAREIIEPLYPDIEARFLSGHTELYPRYKDLGLG